ncbi:MAG: hypothetical protein QOI81_948 [Actinomycetota bacterium]|nr:hypothetical protein [Actinomycetota bacterium]
MTAEAQTYAVELRDTTSGWRVSITDAHGTVAAERTCRDGAEARIYASTVRQHLYWLSPEKFREYYRIEED